MQQLSDYFGVTWVLCTATQPVLTQSKNTFGQVLLKGLNNVREIISNSVELASALKRVEIELPGVNAPKLSWNELALKLKSENCVLAIVNTRRQARKLFELLPDDGNNLHLSANMCAQHRTQVIEQIKKRLGQRKNGDQRPLRVISTQLIEAGVDVDFPVVYRAMAGLDSIAQSAGRCNREGRLDGMGKVIVFNAEESSTDRAGATDNAGKFAEMFKRRAKKGQCFNQPYLGCREFSCGFRLVENAEQERPAISETQSLGWMLFDMDYRVSADPVPLFFNAGMENGVIDVPGRHSEEVRG